MYDVFLGNSSLTTPETVADVNLVNNIFIFDDPPTSSNPQRQLHWWDLDWVPEWKQSLTRLHSVARSGQLVRLENSDCIRAYAPKYQSSNGNLILVTDAGYLNGLEFVERQNMTKPDSYYLGPSRWICSGITEYNEGSKCSSFISKVGPGTDWRVQSQNILYCLSEVTPERCKLQYSLPLAIVVMCFNLIKAIVICFVALTSTETPILTSGDAIASFLRTPDETTKGKCLLSGRYFGTRDQVSRRYFESQDDRQLKYSRKRKRWGLAVSGRRWFACMLS